MAEAKKDVAATKEEIAATKKEIAATKKEIAATKRDIAATKKDIAAAKNGVAEAKKDVAEAKKDMAETRSAIAAAQNASLETEKQLAAARAENAKLRQLLETALRSGRALGIKPDDHTPVAVAGVPNATKAAGEPAGPVDAQTTTLHPSTGRLPEWMRLMIKAEVEAHVDALLARVEKVEATAAAQVEVVKSLVDRADRIEVRQNIISAMIDLSKCYPARGDRAAAQIPGGRSEREGSAKRPCRGCKTCVNLAQTSKEDMASGLSNARP